jgi:hypothetical protein
MSETYLPGSEGNFTLPYLTPAQVITTLLKAVKLKAADNVLDALEDPIAWPYLRWTGKVAGDDAGRFWIPALFASARLPNALRELAKRRKEEGKPNDDESCINSMDGYHSGLGDAQIALLPWVYVEIDHLPRAEQESRYATLAAATGLTWCMWVFSGGKSVHAYLAFTRAMSRGEPLRLQIQKLLIVCLEGDTRITNPSRLMRLPGWNGSRKQPVVRFNPEAAFEPNDVLERLTAYAKVLGITDVDIAFETLHKAERLEKQAEHDADDGNGEMALELLEHAAHLRETRSNPVASDLDLADAMLAPPISMSVSTIKNTNISITSDAFVDLRLDPPKGNAVASGLLSPDTMVQLTD